MKKNKRKLKENVHLKVLGRDSVVGTETRYGLGGTGFEHCWVQEIYSSAECPDRPWGPPNLPLSVSTGARSGRRKRPGVAFTIHPMQRRS